MDDRPLIGITAYEESASWGVRAHEPAALLPSTRLRSVADASSIPVVLPSGRVTSRALWDGSTASCSRAVEPAVLDEAARAGLPVLAICRRHAGAKRRRQSRRSTVTALGGNQ